VQNTTFIGVMVALGTGTAIGIQAVFFTLLGRTVGPVRGSILLNTLAGVLGGTLLLAALVIQGRDQWSIPRAGFIYAVMAAVLGLFIVTGVTFAFQRAGLAAGIATLFLAQMAVGIVVDALGWTGGDPIPVDLRRVAGLVIMAVAIFLLVPRQ